MQEKLFKAVHDNNETTSFQIPEHDFNWVFSGGTVSRNETMQLIDHEKQSPEVFYKKGTLQNFTKFTGKRLCRSLFKKVFNKETLAQVFSWEFSKIFKKTSLRKFERLLLDHDLIKS